MKKVTLRTLLITILSLFVLNSCGPSPSPTVPITPIPKGETIVVTNTADKGPSSLRQALQDVKNGDIITFDPSIFPPDSPIRILLERELPSIDQNYITIDASNAGVILDGSNIATQYANGLQIQSNWCVIQGVQFTGFAGAGIVLSGGAQQNTIGGDQNIGTTPNGQGNVFGDNEIGIGIWSNQTSFNNILGNLIGVDSTGANALGNSIGVYIEDGGSYNIIGPANFIAFNHDAGIHIVHQNSLGNSITQNNIYNNGLDISFSDGGNNELAAPIIFGFDLEAGDIAGHACNNCIIEFFSTNDDGRKEFEGQTTAKNEGYFTFSKGSAFIGPSLIATATDIDGNTSIFSALTTGTEKSVLLQTGNDRPISVFHAKPSNELQDNKLGEMHYLGCTDVNAASEFVDRIQKLGLKWVRVSVDWYDWEEAVESGEFSDFQINPCQEKAIDLMNENGITIYYTLVFQDSKIAEQDLSLEYSRFQVEDEIQRYLEYVQFIVNHFIGKIQYYEILNEPEGTYLTGQYVEVGDYVELVKRTLPIIRQENPDAKIVVGATSDLQYLFGVIESDIMPLVDAISWHPMYGTSPKYDTYKEYYPGLFTDQYYYDYPSIVDLIRDTAYQYGFTGEFWAHELNWRSSLNPNTNPNIYEYDEYSPIEVAKYYGRGIVMHLGMNLTTGLALESLELLPEALMVIQNLSTILAGAEPTNLVVEIDSEVPIIANYNFALLNGDKLVVIWSDGIAVDYDPGVSSSVTIQELSAEKIIGIDVLNGIEQELTFSIEDGNLVIHDLLVKDYPMIIHISDVTIP